MAIEIERKFLVRNDAWRKACGAGIRYVQGYLFISSEGIIRIRLAGERAILGIKKKISDRRRKEFEYEIPADDAAELLQEFSKRPPVEKMRYRLPFKDHIWEVDVFQGENDGLVVAEIELADEAEPFEKPDWLGDEITGEEKYLNAGLYLNPFKRWGRPDS